MARTITHLFLSKKRDLNLTKPDQFSACEYKVKINRVGEINVSATAPVTEIYVPILKPGGGHSNVDSSTKVYDHRFNCLLFTPDGEVFKKQSISIEDLDRYRDLRGFIGEWTLKVSSAKLSQKSSNSRFIRRDFSGEQHIIIKVSETLASSSAPPIVKENNIIIDPGKNFEFDLYRIGNLRASAAPTSANQNTAVKITLFSPDGEIIKFVSNGHLEVEIGPKELRLSRGQDGGIKKWKLRFEVTDKKTYNISAQVYGTFRIPKSALLSRLYALLGPIGEKITIGANWNEGKKTNLVTLTIKDDRLVETLDMHNVFDHFSALNVRTFLENPKKNFPYILFDDPMVVDEGYLQGNFFRAQVKCDNLKSTKIKIEMGKSVVERRALKLQTTGSTVILVPGEIRLPKDLPMFSLSFTMSGTIPVSIDDYDDAELIVPGFRLEIGLEVTNEERLAARCWVDPESIKFGGDEGDAFLFFGYNSLMMKVDGMVEKLTELTGFFEGMFDRLLGGIFRFTTSRWNDDAMEFDYIAGIEQERKPNIGYVARGDFSGPVPGPLRRETWVSPNLSKIDHIVVLMMENRSFDHVLGYLSLDDPEPQINPNVNGLTKKIIGDFSTDGNSVSPLRDAAFPAKENGSITKLPLDVGHHVNHVLQQLAIKDGVPTMTGFAKNFYELHGKKRSPLDNKTDFEREGCKAQDALGYYTDADLQVYGFLAKEFAICDNYFCSHPGPTLPNRMFSLTGDFQRDRNGEPRIDNAVDATFFLSRDQTIFDFLEQRQVSWRVYESPPSVTMLRMFARYAGADKTKIRDIENLKNDISASDLPSVTFIDPRMHDAPPNDDHPPADMLHGQSLIRRVYQALRSNPVIWDKTLFIITYDEHGGLFDHVPPPVAEILQDPQKVIDNDNIGTTGGGSGSTYLPDEKVIYGVRVPTFLISPLVEKGFVLKTLTDHASILKTILIRFCGADRPFMSDRVHNAYDFGAALTLNEPRIIQSAPPSLPTLSNLYVPKKRSIIRKSQLTSETADWHEFMEVLSRTLKPF